jgi:hypothetical protein
MFSVGEGDAAWRDTARIDDRYLIAIREIRMMIIFFFRVFPC